MIEVKEAIQSETHMGQTERQFLLDSKGKAKRQFFFLTKMQLSGLEWKRETEGNTDKLTVKLTKQNVQTKNLPRKLSQTC